MSVSRTASGRLKRAELTSTLGAAMLGAGVALLLSELLKPHALPISAVGLVAHAWGMTDEHHLETRKRGARGRTDVLVME